MSALRAYRIFVLLLIFGLISACSTSPNFQLSDEARLSIGSTDAVVAFNQQEINTDIVRSNASAAVGGGLLFALIDSAVDNSRAKKAEAAVLPIRDHLIDYDYAAFFKDEIEKAVRKVSWLNTDNVELMRETTEQSFKQTYDKSSSETVMYIITNYKLTPQFSGVQVNSSVYLIPKNARLNKYREAKEGDKNPVSIKNAIYRNVFTSLKKLDDPKLDTLAAAELWKENNAQRVKLALQEGAQNIANQLIADLNKNRQVKKE